MKKFVLLLALISLSFGSSQAVITLTIDVNAETISFSGSDTGNAYEEEDWLMGQIEFLLRFWTTPGAGSTTGVRQNSEYRATARYFGLEIV
jgi:hypothetical protein